MALDSAIITKFENWVRAESSRARSEQLEYQGRFESYRDAWYHGYADGLEDCINVPYVAQFDYPNISLGQLRAIIGNQMKKIYYENSDKMMRMRAEHDDEAQEYFLGRSEGNSRANQYFRDELER